MDGRINAIFARGKNGEFALADGNLPWKKKAEFAAESAEDMKRFRLITTGGAVAMGSGTYRTFLHPLPGRINAVIKSGAKNPVQISADEFNFFDSIESAEKKIRESIIPCRKFFLIGGAKILNFALEKKIIDGEIFETVFDAEFPEAQIFFRGNLSDQFKIVRREKFGSAHFFVWRRK
jgi:dihydrofolate reductase